MSAIKELLRAAFGLKRQWIPQAIHDGLGCLQVGLAKVTQLRPQIRKRILIRDDPGAFRSPETSVFVLDEQAALSRPHGIDGLCHMLHDMEVIKVELGRGERDGFKGGLHVRLPQFMAIAATA